MEDMQLTNIVCITLVDARAIIKVSGHQFRWSEGAYDLEIAHFLEVASMVVTWWMDSGFFSAQ